MDSYYFAAEESGANMVALIAVLISLLTLGWTVWSEFTGYRLRQADEYWYRSVFSPNCIDPIIKLLNEHLADLESVSHGKHSVEERRKYGESFAKKKEEILLRLWISHMFSDAYYSTASRCLDGLEDDMAERFSSWGVKPVAACQRDVVILREGAVSGVTEILRAAANIDLNGFLRRKATGRILERCRARFR